MSSLEQIRLFSKLYLCEDGPAQNVCKPAQDVEQSFPVCFNFDDSYPTDPKKYYTNDNHMILRDSFVFLNKEDVDNKEYIELAEMSYDPNPDLYFVRNSFKDRKPTLKLPPDFELFIRHYKEGVWFKSDIFPITTNEYRTEGVHFVKGSPIRSKDFVSDNDSGKEDFASGTINLSDSENDISDKGPSFDFDKGTSEDSEIQNRVWSLVQADFEIIIGAFEDLDDKCFHGKIRPGCFFFDEWFVILKDDNSVDNGAGEIFINCCPDSPYYGNLLVNSSNDDGSTTLLDSFSQFLHIMIDSYDMFKNIKYSEEGKELDRSLNDESTCQLNSLVDWFNDFYSESDYVGYIPFDYNKYSHVLVKSALKKS